MKKLNQKKVFRTFDKKSVVNIEFKNFKNQNLFLRTKRSFLRR